MRDLPIVAKAALNIFLYVLYVLLASVVFSFIFPLIMQLFGQNVFDGNDPIFVKIQYFIAILVLLISLILRKYFYIGAQEDKKTLVVDQNSYTAKKKQVSSKKTSKSAKKQEVKSLEEENDEDEIKIYVEKEIK